VTISGRATLESDPSLKRRLWLDELERWFPNGPEDPNVALIRLDADAAQWWTEHGDGAADLREVAASS
jgi:general stress protein 26